MLPFKNSPLHRKALSLSLPDSKHTRATVVLWCSPCLPCIHSPVPSTHLLFPTLASQALPWDMSALNSPSSQTTGPACHREATRSCWFHQGSLAMRGNPSFKRDRGSENTGGANASSATHRRWHLPCVQGHFTFITDDSESLFFVCPGACGCFPSAQRNKSKALQAGWS